MKYKIYNSEFVAWANSYEGKKFHAVLCDPPYGLEFMGKEWDSFRTSHNDKRSWKSDAEKRSSIMGENLPHLYHAGIGYEKAVKSWGKALRKLLYPGALVFMFGGTRTWHRLAVGMEDAGFELWDTIMWLHGQGFPKAQAIDKLIDKMQGDKRKVIGSRRQRANSNNSQIKMNASIGEVEAITAPGSDLSKSWVGVKTCALKPSWEPILCFRAPDNGKTYAELALKYGSGCLNVDKGRIGANKRFNSAATAKLGTFNCSPGSGKEYIGQEVMGRYPANLCLDKKSARMLDEQTGKRPAAGLYRKECETPSSFTGKRDGFGYGDIGGASRFFYTAKAPKYERNEGLEFFTPHQCGIGALRDSGRGKIATNVHPTVKPISLNKWLAAMLLPAESVKRRRLLVPFSGSGSEMIGALRAGWDKVIGVEMNKDYCRIAKSRLKYWKKYKPVWKNLI